MNGLPGAVFRPGDEGYDEERRGFNLAVDHHPALVVGATRAEDVVAAVRYAAEAGLGVGVQATGHGPAVPADGQLLISTRRMVGVRVDPVARTATVDAGTRWVDVVAAAAPYGLAPLNGSSADVGAVGYLLGGGLAVLGRRFGYAADHVRRFEVVTADGELRGVSPESEPDLFWALRGGKGNFGVVTSMEIELFPVATLYGGGLYFDADTAAAALHAYREWTGTVSEEMSSSVMLTRFPDLPEVPDPLRDRYVAHVWIAWSGPVAEGERWVQPLRAAGPVLLDTVAEMPYREGSTVHHEPTTPLPTYDRNTALGAVDSAAVDTILELAGPEADAPFLLELRHHGGAYARPPEVPNAVAGRDAAFLLFSVSVLDPDRIAEIRGSHDTLHRRMHPWSTGGVFLNFLGIHDTGVESVRSAYRTADYERLTAVKAAHDPGNLFRINHNIPPAAA